MKVPYLDLAQVNATLREKLLSAIDNCLERSVFWILEFA